MNKNINAIIVIILIAFVRFADAQFTGKIVVRGKWGSKPGEFGLYTKMPGAGPSDVVVSRKGNIYIADAVNGRIVVYRNGKYIRSMKEPVGISSLGIDSKENLYCSNGETTVAIDSLGDVIASVGLGGVVKIDRDTVFLLRDYTSYVCILDKKNKSLNEVRKVEETGVGGITISKGIEFRLAPDKSIQKSGLAMLRINSKETIITMKSKGKASDVKADNAALFGFKRANIREGDDSGNVYLYDGIGFAKVNTKGVLTGIFIPATDDSKIINIPYAPCEYARIQNGKLYYMGSYREAEVVKKNGKKKTKYVPKDFMIIEYEFKPVE
jgi:hypothetical protein